MSSSNEIPVFFTIDDGYAPYLSTALYSAVSNASPDRQYHAYVIHEDLTPENQARLAALATDNFKIDFIPMQMELDSITNSSANFLRCDFFTLTIFFRIFIPAMFPQYDKGIYIDSDTMILDDLAKLYDIDLEGNYLAASLDYSIWDIAPFMEYTREAVGIPDKNYFNSAILLMDMKTLREKHLGEHFLDLLTTYHFDTIDPDQAYLNAMCLGHVKFLPPTWDVMPGEHVLTPDDKPQLIHYNLFSKPWYYDDIAYESYYWQYAPDCGFYQEVLDGKANYSDEQKAADQATMQRMCDNAISIVQNDDITFRKMYESGVKIRL